MSEELMKLVVDLATGEQKYIPLSAEEIAEREQMFEQAEADRLAREEQEAANEEAKASAIAKLSGLGLTEEEITALVK
jgi:DNA-binding transcriptional regulator YhcF (GntR family)